ncbi:MAG: Eco57I restriction-modification methylase domain-containing protein [Tannerella sp.]|jgi:hypothetical protein|nr:Eco57I restriction-modification methylase domain-containing protein [Tannerella sp.]
MSTDDHTLPALSSLQPHAADPSAHSPFSGELSYAVLLEQLELKELRENGRYALAPASGEQWVWNADEGAAAALQPLIDEGNTRVRKLVAMLTFVADRLRPSARIPSHVISYLCSDAVTRTVLQRFNAAIGGNSTTLTELSYRIGDNVAEANDIFRTIRFCDPATGSGVFPAALLNEMIAVKSQLGILADLDGNPLFQYKVTVEEGELAVYDKKRFGACSFKASDPESRRIQETFLHEKKTLVEQCLFGVDLNPTAVSVCRLRLWTELLKHLCRETDPRLSASVATCNIRCGDALVSRFSLHEDLREVFRRIEYGGMDDYRRMVEESKRARTGEAKSDAGRMIELLRMKIRRELIRSDRNSEELLKWQRELDLLREPALFTLDEGKRQAVKDRIHNAQAMIERCRRKIEEFEHNPVFEQAVEWRYEFPELWNETGDYAGFDCIVGNPPDTQDMRMNEAAGQYKQTYYKSYRQTGEAVSLFCELGNRLLKPEGFLSYITSNSWMQSAPAGKMCRYLMEEMNPLWAIELNTSRPEPEGASAPKGIVILQKARNQYRMMSCRIDDGFDCRKMKLADYIRQHATPFTVEDNGRFDTPAPFTVLSGTEKEIKAKIEQTGTPLKAWDIRMYTGICTGCDEAFIIDGKQKDEFIRNDYKNTDIIKPLLRGDDVRPFAPAKTDLWLICLPWHFPLLYDATIKAASDRAEQRFRQQYPAICEHLEKYRDKLFGRNEAGVTFEWYALQRYGATAEWDDFLTQKIVWKQESETTGFCIDYRGCAILDTACFAVGQHLKYLLGVLNSKPGRYLLHDLPRMTDGKVRIGMSTMEALKVPVPNIKVESEMISWINKRTSDAHRDERAVIDRKIDEYVYDMYKLNQEEREWIETTILSI